MISSESSMHRLEEPMSWVFPIISVVHLIAMIVYQRVFNTMKLYAKQRRLTTLVTNQIYDKRKNNRMMDIYLKPDCRISKWRDGPHVLHIHTLTGMILEKLEQKTDKYNLSWSREQINYTRFFSS